MATDDGNQVASGNVVSLPRWGTSTEAAEAYGISPRTLRLWASGGKVERRGSGRSTRYRMPDGKRQVATDAGMPDAAMPRLPAMPRQVATDAGNPAAAGIDALRDELASLRRAVVDAERRAAVAEYRAEIADADADELEALRTDVGHLRDELHQVRAERDQARSLAQTYADTLRRRHATVQRLLQRLRGA